MNPVMTGLMMPGMVPMVLEMPIRMAAYCGAMSRWLMEKPAQAKPPQPSESDMLQGVLRQSSLVDLNLDLSLILKICHQYSLKFSPI